MNPFRTRVIVSRTKSKCLANRGVRHKSCGGVKQLRRYQVPRRGTTSLAVGETHGQRPSHPTPYRPRRGRTFSWSDGGKPHSTPLGWVEHRGPSFPWVSPTANDLGPLRGPPPGSGGKAQPSTFMSHTRAPFMIASRPFA